MWKVLQNASLHQGRIRSYQTVSFLQHQLLWNSTLYQSSNYKYVTRTDVLTSSIPVRPTPTALHINLNSFRKLSTNSDDSLISTLESEAEALITTLSNHHESSNISLVNFDSVMHSLSKQPNMRAAQKVEKLLLALEENNRHTLNVNPSLSMANNNQKLIPNVVSYNYACHAYAQSGGGKQAAVCAEKILDRMLENCRNYCSSLRNHSNLNNSRVPPPEPSTQTFHNVMNAWSKSGEYDSGISAERVFRKMESWLHECNAYHDEKHSQHSIPYFGAVPTTRSLAIVLDAWSGSNSKESVERAITILNHSIDKWRECMHYPLSEIQSHKWGTVMRINNVVFHATLKTLANNSRGYDDAVTAENIVNLMQELNDEGIFNDSRNPQGKDKVDSRYENLNRNDGDDDDETATLAFNTRTFTLLLQCWSKSLEHEVGEMKKKAAIQADAVLEKMENLYQKGYNVKPNIISYATCVNAWSKCESEDCIQRVISLFERLQSIYEKTGDDDLKPNSVFCNSCLVTICRSNITGSMSKAMDFLKMMELHKIADTGSYNIVMDGYIKQYKKDAFPYVSALFDSMKQNNHSSPDTITYNTIMDAIGYSKKHDNSDKVMKLLDDMPNPNTRSYTIALNAIKRSSNSEKAEPARNVLYKCMSMYENTKENSLKPDMFIFASFISACAYENSNDERKRIALKLILATFENLKKKSAEYGTPNSHLYCSVMQACERLAYDLDERDRLLEKLFNLCLVDNMVTDQTWRIIQRACSINLKEKLMNSYKPLRNKV